MLPPCAPGLEEPRVRPLPATKGTVFEDVHIIITPPKGTSQIVPTHINVSKFTDVIIKTLQSDIVCQFTSCIIYSSCKILEDHTPILGDPVFRDLARIWLHWKGTGEGYGYFHKYEPLPGIGQARPLYFKNPHVAVFQRAALTLNNATHFFGIYEEASDTLGHSYFRPYQNSNIALFEFCSTCFMTSIDFILNRPNRKADTKWKTEMASRSKLVLSFFRKVLSWGAPALEESQEMIQRWWLALAKKEAAKCRLEEAQQEFEDYESDIIEVIGPATYNHFLNMYVAALARNSSGQSAYFDEFMLLTPMPDLT
ncbi:hypothetical protein PAXINDRAFT_16554 [Paxillus involutus ATCC 200175]|uniref:Unplaced genomic scaffold PAXINscaffold_83, whole genome shotgun sequence n=1 Tax=Paxillus involutus ATCC 200175 TaxID=664439 RepID=A0A0C9TI82_PAXIN|nr:hypothetical protein PAXINDRAFT_16554 [Paxillus involutus ATCC 200175]